MYLMIVTGEWPNKNSRYLLSDYKKQNKQILAGLLYAFQS